MATLKNWISRGVIHVPAKEWTDTNRLRFSFIRIMQIALTAELRDWGMEAQKASSLAMSFTDIGETGGGWHGDPVRLTRAPGQLFPKGSTIFVANRNSNTARIVNVGGGSKVQAVDLLPHDAISAVLIDVDGLDRKVRCALGVQ